MPTLCEVRAAAHLTQRELAARAGVSSATIARIERGRTRPSPRVVSRLSRALGEVPEAITEFRAVACRTQLPQPMVRPAQPHLLVLDASPAVLAALRELLEGEGYRVSTGSTPELDLESIVCLAPDLILLEGVGETTETSASLVHALRAHPRTSTIPLILGTCGGCEAEEVQRDLAEPNLWVVGRPFDLEQLLGAVRAALRLSAATA